MRSFRQSRHCSARDAFTASQALGHVFLAQRRNLATSEESSHDGPDKTFRRVKTFERRLNGTANISKEVVRANKRQMNDINPQDLSATLEAHRASNDEHAKQRAVRTDQQLSTHNGYTEERSNHGHETVRRRAATKKDFAQYREAYFKRDARSTSGQLDSSTSKKNPKKKPTTFASLQGQGSTKNLKSTSKRATKSDSTTLSTSLEYEGQALEPLVDTIVADHKLPWYIPEDERQGMNGVQRLNLEMEKFNAFIRPTPVHNAARLEVIKSAREEIRSTLALTATEVYGSVRSGLATATSDVDIRICMHDPAADWDSVQAPRHLARKILTSRLEVLHYRLRENVNDFVLVQLRHARYPLIAMQHKHSGIDVQIVASNDSVLSRRSIHSLLQRWPGLLDVFQVVKTTLDVRGVVDVFRGGVGSYTIFMMVAASFQLNPSSRSNNLAQNLLAFLSFWSQHDLHKYGISVEPPELFPKTLRAQKKEKPRRTEDLKKDDEVSEGRRQMGLIDKAQPFLLCLQDPADPFNDLGHKAYGIKHIQATIQALYASLVMQTHRNTAGSLLSALVGPSYPIKLAVREKLEGYGQSLLDEGHRGILGEDDLKWQPGRSLESGEVEVLSARMAALEAAQQAANIEAAKKVALEEAEKEESDRLAAEYFESESARRREEEALEAAQQAANMVEDENVASEETEQEESDKIAAEYFESESARRSEEEAQEKAGVEVAAEARQLYGTLTAGMDHLDRKTDPGTEVEPPVDSEDIIARHDDDWQDLAFASEEIGANMPVSEDGVPTEDEEGEGHARQSDASPEDDIQEEERIEKKAASSS